MKVETLQSSLGALKRNGAVQGIILSCNASVLFADFPFSREQIDHLTKVFDDIGFYFRKENRRVDQVAFGYEGACLLILSDDAYRLFILHGPGDDLDFLARAGKSLLLDYQMALFAAQFEKDLNQSQAIRVVNPEPEPITRESIKTQEAQRPATQRISLKAEKGFDQPAPLQSRPNPQPSYPTARGR